MATRTGTSNLRKPWAWLAAVAAVCLVLASSTALYVINPGVRLGLPWWMALAAPALVYALVLPLCIPRIRLGGWLVGFFALAFLHVILGLATAWLYAHVGLTSFEEALTQAFWGFPPALVLDVVGSLLGMLPFMGALAPRPAAPRIPQETASPRDAMGRKARELPAPPDKGRQAWARPSKPGEPAAAPAVTPMVSAVPPPVTALAPAIEEPPVAAPGPLIAHAAPLSGTNGAPPETADDTMEAVPDFRQALSELFDTRASASSTQIEETLEPSAEPVIDEASPHLTAEVPAWVVPETTTAPPIDVAPATPEAVASRAPGAVVRIPFDRVVGQFPPGAFRVPLPQVGARLREAETLLVAEALIVPQLGEGVVQVAWEAVAEQFPADVFAVPPAEMKERIANGRLLLPLDEIVKQLPPDVFGASMGRGPVEIPGIESFPAPFKPLGWKEPAPSPVASGAGPLTEPAPLSIEVPSETEVPEDLKWTPPSPAARLEAPADAIEPPPAEAESAMTSASDHAVLVDGGEPAPAIQLDRALESETTPVMVTPAPDGGPMREAAVEPERSDPTTAVEPILVEAVIRIPFDRVAAQLPPEAFRVPLPEVGARLREADTLVVAQALVVPQLGEGAVRVAWDAVVEQFPAEVFAVLPADVKDRIEGGWLSLPLDEIVRQLSADVFGAAMGRGPVQVPGIESFPAPFKPLGREEPAPPVPEPPLSQLMTAPVPVEPAIELAVPETAAVPQPVPVAPLGEAQVFARPVPSEPPVQRRDRAERIAALVAPLEAAALDEVRVGDFTIISVSTSGMTGGAVTAPAGRLGPVIARAASQPIEQVTLRGVGGMLVLTPVGSGWSSGTVLAVGMRSGGALARLEMLARRAAAGHELEREPAPARAAAPFARLDATETPSALAAAALDLTTLGSLAALSYREPASGAIIHCLLSPGVLAAEVAPFAWELAQVMAQSAPAETLGSFHSAVLRSGSARVEIRRLPSAVGPALILVVGGADRGRPGLAHLQIQRTAARLTGA